MNYLKTVLLIFLLSAEILGQNTQFSVVEVVNHLSSKELEGRRAGTRGEFLASKYLEEQFIKIGLEPIHGKFISPFNFSERLNENDSLVSDRTGHNVIAEIDNNQSKTIVIAAHYDHLGKGYHPSSLESEPEGKIHFGADDNASGVAGMLAIANYLNNNDRIENNNYIFISFSAEELGLFGSKAWLENTSIDLSNISAMINLDMIGRLDSTTNQIEIYGTGTSTKWNEIIDSSNTYFKLKKISSGIGASDHNSFYLKNIPAIHIFTGTHQDYHKSTDTAEKINFNGIDSIQTFVIRVLEKLEYEPPLPFQKTKSSSNSKRSKMKVTMGIIPSYINHDKGLLIDGVISQKPAENGGLKEGDVITEINGKVIKDIYDYMDQLSQFDSGDTTQVTILRNETIKILIIKF